MIKISISNKVIVENLPSYFLAMVISKLKVKNPLFEKLKRMKNIKALHACKEYFTYYRVCNNPSAIMIPRGMEDRIIAFVKKTKLKYKVTHRVVEKPRLDMIVPQVTLRDYQQELSQKLLQKNTGILEMSMGSGKTITGLEVAYQSKLKTLIIVDRTHLMHQWAAECKKFYGYEPGLVGDGNQTIKDITIATWQSLDKDHPFSLYDQTGTIIIDECHGAISEKRQAILRDFSPKRLYGLTATAKRSFDDGRTDAIKIVCGPIVGRYEIDQVPPKVSVIDTGFRLKNYDYHRLEEEVAEHPGRNKSIAAHALSEAVNGKKVLILTKRKAHYKAIYDELPTRDTIYTIDSDDADRATLLQLLKEGLASYEIILGTYSLLGTGFDIPTLDTLIMAGSVKSDVLTAQACGRVLRLLNGKEPIIYDYVDNSAIYKRHAAERMKVYKARNWEVIK